MLCHGAARPDQVRSGFQLGLSTSHTFSAVTGEWLPCTPKTLTVP